MPNVWSTKTHNKRNGPGVPVPLHRYASAVTFVILITQVIGHKTAHEGISASFYGVWQIRHRKHLYRLCSFAKATLCRDLATNAMIHRLLTTLIGLHCLMAQGPPC